MTRKSFPVPLTPEQQKQADEIWKLVDDHVQHSKECINGPNPWADKAEYNLKMRLALLLQKAVP